MVSPNSPEFRTFFRDAAGEGLRSPCQQQFGIVYPGFKTSIVSPQLLRKRFPKNAVSFVNFSTQFNFKLVDVVIVFQVPT